MFSAADLIQALQRRMLLRSPHLRRPAGEFPPGWQRWFEQMRERIGAVTGAPSEAIVDEMLHRPLSTVPPSVGELTRWQAFATLWRQEWHAPAPEDRKVRWIAGIVSALWHIFFGLLLIWLMYVRFMAMPGMPATGENVVQVEYIGRGTPQQAGGAQPPTPATPSPPSPARPAIPAPATEPQMTAPEMAIAPAEVTPILDAPPPDVAQRDVPEPPPAAEQPVIVSEPVPSEPTVFVLPPTRKRVEPAVTAPDLSAEPRQVQAVEVPEPLQARQHELPQRQIEAPELASQAPDVAQREIPVPLPRVTLPELAAPPTSAPELQAPTPAVRTAEIPTPRAPVGPPPSAPAAPSQPAAAAGPPATAPATATAAPSPSPAATSTGPATTPAVTAPARPAAAAGTGPKPAAAPGGWPSPKRGDDWGAAARERPGGQSGQEPGLYNPDGSVRIADTAEASPGQPPGTVTEEIKDLDRAGVWLKRKPTDYEPTAFDKYWRPSESLLQEWVRRSIKRVLIPIPGTGKRIVCDVTLLAFGGGCGIVDPNLNEQPASARPPPDIPFKPALQEDNGSVKP